MFIKTDFTIGYAAFSVIAMGLVAFATFTSVGFDVTVNVYLPRVVACSCLCAAALVKEVS